MGNAPYIPDYSATFLISRTTLTSASSSVTFSSIPSTYQHLQLRVNFLADSTNGYAAWIRLNGSSSSIYSWHYLYGNGSSAGAGSGASSTWIYAGTVNGFNTTYPQVGIYDIHDYTSTAKNKTLRGFAGIDLNGSGDAGLYSGLWQSTSAITSLTFVSDVAFKTGSTFALYGMKG